MLLAAKLHLHLKEYGQAEQVLRRAVETDPAVMPAYAMLGNVFFAQGRVDDALVEYQGIVKRDPKSAGALTIVGMLQQQQQRRVEAKAAYQQALAVDKDAAVAANNLAWMYAEDDEHLDEALQLAQTARARMPESADAGDTLGWVLYKKGLFDSAISILKEAATQDPKNADLQYHLGLAYAKTGDSRLARQKLESALSLSPTSALASEARSTLDRIAAMGS
jgi:tetratricopeptide (TPR) repeat protein